MAERVTPAGFGGSGRDVGVSQDPIMFLVPLEDASTPSPQWLTLLTIYSRVISSFFLYFKVKMDPAPGSESH